MRLAVRFALLAVLVVNAAACSRHRWAEPQDDVWPGVDARLSVLPVTFPGDFGVRKVFVDAGHGAPGNKGALSSWCEDEQDFTLAAAEHLAASLAATGHFEPRVSRSSTGVSYGDRVQDAERWGAEAFISLHSDVRGAAGQWAPREGLSCPRSDAAPGFAVLYSDEGGPARAGMRARLAGLMAQSLEAAGFPAYDGAEYTHAYQAAAAPGVFLDRHPPDKRIFVLRQPSMPSVLIETHNALFAAEAERFREPRTLDAFDSAVAAALVQALSAVR